MQLLPDASPSKLIEWIGSTLDDFDGDAFRAVYTLKCAGVVYVLHVFQKKSTHGIATPTRELTIIRDRWRRAKAHYEEHYGEASGGARRG